MTILRYTTAAILAIAISVLFPGLLPISAQDTDKVATVVVEHVSKKPRRNDGGLGTTFYSPSEKEKPHYQKLAPVEKSSGGLAGNYDISKKDKSNVGWFGVVRGVEQQKDKNQTLLLVEHKYFDGLTDAHILALSFNGSGDFRVIISGIRHKIEPLTLVKVYGVVSLAKADSKPEIKAEFVRNWHWGTFTFLHASGQQRGSQKWRKLNSVDLGDIYDPYPDDQYYKLRLGKR